MVRNGISTPLFWPFLLAKVLKNALLETLRLQKSSATQVQISQREVHDETIGVLSDAAITDFVKTKDALEDVKYMFDARAHARFCSVRRSFAIGDFFRA